MTETHDLMTPAPEIIPASRPSASEIKARLLAWSSDHDTRRKQAMSSPVHTAIFGGLAVIGGLALARLVSRAPVRASVITTQRSGLIELALRSTMMIRAVLWLIANAKRPRSPL